VEIDAPAGDVWEAVADPDRRALWLDDPDARVFLLGGFLDDPRHAGTVGAALAQLEEGDWEVVDQIEPLRKLLEARQKLADLRNKMAGNDKFEDLLNEVLQNTDKIVVFVDEVRRMGLTLVPPCVNRSDYRFTTLDRTIVYGLGAKTFRSGCLQPDRRVITIEWHRRWRRSISFPARIVVGIS
jgi:hypothetical protein